WSRPIRGRHLPGRRVAAGARRTDHVPQGGDGQTTGPLEPEGLRLRRRDAGDRFDLGERHLPRLERQPETRERFDDPLEAEDRLTSTQAHPEPLGQVVAETDVSQQTVEPPGAQVLQARRQTTVDERAGTADAQKAALEETRRE